MKAWRHVPLFEFETFDAFLEMLPRDCILVGIEIGGKDLISYSHPERCIYLLGAEDHGLSEDVLKSCQHVISIPSTRTESYNVAVAGSIVMYDRATKQAKKLRRIP